MTFLHSQARRLVRNAFLALPNFLRPARYVDVRGEVLRKTNLVVNAGPFKGMRYLDVSWGSALLPKLVGTYEQELHRVFEDVFRSEYDRFVDIGCAEGYYAVGVALRLRESKPTQVLAYDIAPESSRMLRELARINDVEDLVVFSGVCTYDDIENTSGRCLLLCDIEGAEVELLDPYRAPRLREFDILVEVHDLPGTETNMRLLRNRFSCSHLIEQISFEGRETAAKHRFPFFRSSLNLQAMDEYRSLGKNWLWMRPKR